MVPHRRSKKQSLSVPRAKQSHSTGDALQPAASATTPGPGGTTGVPWVVTRLETVIFRRALPDNDLDTLDVCP
jgi:hypothetical protein